MKWKDILKGLAIVGGIVGGALLLKHVFGAMPAPAPTHEEEVEVVLKPSQIYIAFE